MAVGIWAQLVMFMSILPRNCEKSNALGKKVMFDENPVHMSGITITLQSTRAYDDGGGGARPVLGINCVVVIFLHRSLAPPYLFGLIGGPIYPKGTWIINSSRSQQSFREI